ncbi:biotin carboxylase [Saccharomonospora marina XMU15]|uniref:Biotin carboxylase n=1 Tax=Saccharomonospora marina XMU15 TaxID=882083 RepID=H5X7R7_9PSEU|nr:ATP-grasp domain-containing protein [Saccharomonospora marina]EHR51360.1 biotin carboxylase [Saccharomonospora marina XMU15]
MTSTALLLLVESNTTGTGRQFARYARNLGIEPVLVTADPARYPYVTEDHLRTALTDTSSEAAVLATARELAEQARIAGVTSSSEYYVATAAAIARHLGLPGPDPDAVRACQDKSRQRRLLAAAGVPVPHSVLAQDVEGAVVATADLGHPVVLKPPRGSGSLGVRLCAGVAETADHAAELTSAVVNERGIAVQPGVLVEQYVRGTEYSVEVFGNTAVVVVRKYLGPLPEFVELGHDLPAALDSVGETRLKDCAVRSVRALGLGWGAAHVELRMDGEEIRVMEVNPRLAGGMIPELTHQALGIDLVGAQVQAALGRRPTLIAGPRRGAAIRFLTAEAPGVLADGMTTTAALSAARRVPGVVAAVLYRAPGERVVPAKDFRGRLGHVIAVTDQTSAGLAADEGRQALAAVLDTPAAEKEAVV